MVLQRKLEKACKAYIEQLSGENSLGLHVTTGQSADLKGTPAVICAAGQGSEDFPNSGIYHVPVEIHVCYMAADNADDALDSTADIILQAFSKDTTPTVIQDLMSEATGFTILEIYSAGQTVLFKEDTHIQILGFNMVACLS